MGLKNSSSSYLKVSESVLKSREDVVDVGDCCCTSSAVVSVACDEEFDEVFGKSEDFVNSCGDSLGTSEIGFEVGTCEYACWRCDRVIK